VTLRGWSKAKSYSFDADDNNSGFLPVMKISLGVPIPIIKIVLTEKSSKAISEQKGHLGTGEKSTATYRKDLSLQADRPPR
jgi:hypothetical protein